MKVLVCGGRDFQNENFVWESLDAIVIDLLIEGGANGADKCAHDYAVQMRIPHLTVPANWPLYGKKAGILRNIKMLKEYRPDLVVAFPGGNGTAHMVRIAREAGVEVRTLQPQ